jgi:folate-dependent tRNA-U54 methylase TrmFO/GidA
MIAGLERQCVRERLALHERQARFGEHFLHVELTVRVERRRALAGEIAGLEGFVGATCASVRSSMNMNSV